MRFVQMLRAYQRAEACIVLLKDARSAEGCYSRWCQRKVVPVSRSARSLPGSHARDSTTALSYTAPGVFSGAHRRAVLRADFAAGDGPDAVRIAALAHCSKHPRS